MSNLKKKTEPHIRLLYSFRKIMTITEVQIAIPAVYQIYLLLCLRFGFNLKKESLLLLCTFLLLDALMIGVKFILTRFVPMTVSGQVLCAVNLLLTAGLSGQSVYENRFFATVSYFDNGFEFVKASLFSTGKQMLIGAALGGVCFGVCILLKKLSATDRQANKKSNPLICYLLFAFFILACVAVLTLLFIFDNGTDSSNQWLGGMQPGEFLKFAFLFLLAFVSGFESEQKAWSVFKPVIQFGSLLVMMAYYAALGEFGSLLVIAFSFILFLVVSNRNWLYTGILILVALCIGLPAMGVIIHEGNEFIEEKYTLTTQEKEELAEKEYYGLLEDGEEPYVEPDANFFERQYEKIYMRFMIVKDVDGTDPSILPGVREAIREIYAYQPAAALNAIGISGIVPYNAPVFHYVTHADTDYIYTSVLQCGGLLSVIVMLFAYLLLADSAFSLISSNCDMTNRYLVFSMISSVLLQMSINILGVNNLIPLTGITLPFVSRGGSSLVVSLMMIAVVFFADFDYMRKKTKLKADWNERNDNTQGAIVYETTDFLVENE